MKKVFNGVNRTAAVLLAAVLLITSLPWAGVYTYAADQTDTVAAVTSQSGPDTEEVLPSQDGIDSKYASLSETGGTGEYLTDDTLGYTLTDVAVTPGSYAANFLAKVKGSMNASVTMLYTEDKELADSFFPGVTKTAIADATALGFRESYVSARDSSWKQDANGGLYYEKTWNFTGDTHLTPETTYYYRIVCKKDSESMYYFLSLPGQFTYRCAGGDLLGENYGSGGGGSRI